MAQQTAVEWLVEQIKDYDFAPITNTDEYAIVIPVWIFKDKITQAKAMEKQQHGHTWDEAIDTHERRGHVIARSIVDFDDYYNETYTNGL